MASARAAYEHVSQRESISLLARPRKFHLDITFRRMQMLGITSIVRRMHKKFPRRRETPTRIAFFLAIILPVFTHFSAFSYASFLSLLRDI